MHPELLNWYNKMYSCLYVEMSGKENVMWISTSYVPHKWALHITQIRAPATVGPEVIVELVSTVLIL